MRIKDNNRRRFIGNVAKAGLLGFMPAPALQKVVLDNAFADNATFFLTKPYLQNLSQESCTVMWITGKPCESWVEFGTTKELGQKAFASHLGLIDANNTINKIALPNLKAGTRYYYSVCSKEITSFKPYALVFGDTQKSEVYSFETPKAVTDTVSWLVLNDIHDRPASFAKLFSFVEKDKHDFVFLNGDMFDYQTDEQQMIDHLLTPLTDIFASQMAFLYTRGNHETRGKFAREHNLYFDNPGNRYYFSFTQGPVHFTVLDTGEDKEDDHKEYGGLAAFDAYRIEQAKWLEKEIESKAFKQAPFRVVMMHIPLYESGDWHGTMHCRQLFNPLFNKGKIDLLICGHTHKYGVHPADPATHNYPLVIGGGPLEGKRTIISVTANKKQLTLTMLGDNGTEVGRVDVQSKKG